jgi:hypothetical protein
VVDPLLQQAAVDVADVSRFCAFVAASDVVEWQSFLANVTDLDRAKRLIVSLAATHVAFVGSICEQTGADVAQVLRDHAHEKLQDARLLQPPPDGAA